MADHNATGAVSRRNVLKATGGLLTGSTMLAGLGAGRGAAETEAERRVQFEIEDANEEVTIANVFNFPPGRVSSFITNSEGQRLSDTIFLGLAERFVIHEDEDAVSLGTPEIPEIPEEVLANPFEIERLDEETYRMYFRTRDVDLSEVEDKEVTLGLGYFPERTVPEGYFDTTGGEIQ